MSNELAVGSQAPQSPLVIPLNKPADLNGKTQQEILAMRSQIVAGNAALVRGAYVPNQDVFGEIVDGRPWWGTAGAAIYGAGSQSILGPSEESRFILNPMLLVGLNSATLEIWRADLMSESDINNPDFPYFWPPERLEMDAKNYRAMVSYDVTGYLKRINDTGKLTKPVLTPNFSLVAYNARDFGYNYIYADMQQCKNIKNQFDERRPVRLTQFIHCGGSCGYPGGCNNMSPYTQAIDRLLFTKLPARVTVYLWKQQPTVSQVPDFTVYIDLR
jgi:hypothetical protein